MRGVIRCGLLSLLAVFLLAGGCLAADYDGYIIRLKPQVSLLSAARELPEGMEEVYEPQNLYTTHDEELIRELEEAGLLEYAEPNYLIELFDMPDDPAYRNGLQWNLDLLGMDYAWERGITGAARSERETTVRVGVIDTGLYAAHEEFQGVKLIQGVNTCAKEGTAAWTDTTDEIGHGTFVSGIVAAATGNGVGIAGAAPGVELVPLKCYDRSGGDALTLSAAIYAGVDELDCQVLNMSLGIPGKSETLKAAVSHAVEQGVLLVAAAGNDGNAALWYPAAFSLDGFPVIGVGAVDQNKEVAYFSNRNESVCVVAPGVDLYSLAISGEKNYRTDSGTSFSAPQVTAAAALALSVRPELTADGFKRLLRETSEDLGEPGYDKTYGYGLLNIGELLKTVQTTDYTVQEGGVRLTAWGLVPGSRAWVVQAAYTQGGAQQAVAMTELTAAADSSLEGLLELQVEGERVVFLLLDETWQPLAARWEKPAPEEPDETEPPAGEGGEDGTQTGDSPSGEETNPEETPSGEP